MISAMAARLSASGSRSASAKKALACCSRSSEAAVGQGIPPDGGCGRSAVSSAGRMFMWAALSGQDIQADGVRKAEWPEP